MKFLSFGLKFHQDFLARNFLAFDLLDPGQTLNSFCLDAGRIFKSFAFFLSLGLRPVKVL